MAARPLILAVDVGTSALKAALFDSRLRLRALAAAPYPVERPHPGWVEADPRRWWRVLTKTVRLLLTDDDAARVAVMTFSALYSAVVLVDDRLRPLRPAILYCDMRSEAEGRSFERRIGRRRLLERTGSAIHPGTPALSSIVWLARHEPATLRRTRHLLQPNSYVAARLTGRVAMDVNTASITGLLDVRGVPKWWTSLARRAGLDPAALPALVPCHQPIGGLTRSGARALGLRPGVPVVLGAGDSACAALAGGLLGPGLGTVACGSTDTVAACTREPLLPEGLINVNHAVPRRYLAQASVSSAGLAVKWVVDLLYGNQPGAFDRALREAGDVSPGAGGLVFLPYLQGERTPIWDACARGAFVGLSPGTGRAECVRAALEGVAFALRHNVEAVEQGLGRSLKRVVLLGGGARSGRLNQIRADVLGRSVRRFQLGVRDVRSRSGPGRERVSGPEGSAAMSVAGAAILGAVGVGLQPSFRAAVSALAEGGELQVFRPRGKAVRAYERLYKTYLGLYPALRRPFTRLQSLRTS